MSLADLGNDIHGHEHIKGIVYPSANILFVVVLLSGSLA